MREVFYYVTKEGKCPFNEWLIKLDKKVQSIIKNRIDRLQDELKGDWKKLKNSELSELRIFIGKGYRIYYKEIDNILLLIIAGSDKDNQEYSIKQANKYYKDYLERLNNE